MKNRINVAELLMECPEGMELDCPLYRKCQEDPVCRF
jgi:hypothetical protein